MDIDIPTKEPNTLTLDDMISFLISLKETYHIPGDTEIVVEYDCEDMTLSTAEITSIVEYDCEDMTLSTAEITSKKIKFY
jgi:hypothetical protein